MWLNCLSHTTLSYMTNIASHKNTTCARGKKGGGVIVTVKPYLSVVFLFSLCCMHLYFIVIYWTYSSIFSNLHLTINSILDVTFHCNALLAIRVTFVVSEQLAFSMMKFVIFTRTSDFKKCGPLYHDTFGKGLLDISLLRTTLTLINNHDWVIFHWWFICVW